MLEAREPFSAILEETLAPFLAERRAGPTDDLLSLVVHATTGDAERSLSLYTRFLGAAEWSDVDLDEVWTGPSAPPTDGILATVRLTHFNRFLAAGAHTPAGTP